MAVTLAGYAVPGDGETDARWPTFTEWMASSETSMVSWTAPRPTISIASEVLIEPPLVNGWVATVPSMGASSVAWSRSSSACVSASLAFATLAVADATLVV